MTQDMRIVILSRLTVGEEFARFRAARKQRLKDEEALRIARAEYQKQRARDHHHIKHGEGKMLRRGDGWTCSRCGKAFKP